MERTLSYLTLDEMNFQILSVAVLSLEALCADE